MIEQVAHDLLFEHAEVLNVSKKSLVTEKHLNGRAMPEQLHSELTDALRPLPDGAIWAIAQPSPGVYVLADEELVLVTLDPDTKTVTVLRRQVPGNTVVSCQEVPLEQDDWRTNVEMCHTWTFRYAEEEPDGIVTDMLHRIEGAVLGDPATATQRPDEREAIARSIAAQSTGPA